MRFVVFLFLLLSGLPLTAAAEEFGADNVLEERLFLNNSYVPNYRELMRDTIVAVSDFAREARPGFKIIVEEGRDLISLGQWEIDLNELHRAEMEGATTDDERFLLKLFSPDDKITVGMPNRRYLQAIDGVFFKDRFCGKNALPADTKKLLDNAGVTVFGVEHCDTAEKKAEAQQKAAKEKTALHADTDKKEAFASTGEDKQLFLENPNGTEHLNDVRNVLIMTNNQAYSSKGEWVDALAATNYDMIAIDPFFRFNRPLSAQDVQRLKYKKLGSKRLVFAVLNLSVAEDTRLYWDLTWKLKSPYWLRFPTEGNEAGITVDYWNTEWKKILGVYFKEIVSLGYDGVYLTGLDAHKIFERIVLIN